MKMTVTGIADVDAMLTDVAPRLANNILRATVHGVAGEIRDQARRFEPDDTGTLKKATVTRRRRGEFGRIRSDVMVTRAAFYWRFLEYGQGPGGVEYAMFGRAVEKIGPSLGQIFLEQFGRKFEAAMVREARRNGRRG